MAAMFDRHSRVAVPPETHFFTDVCSAKRGHCRVDGAAMVNHVFRGKRIQDLQLDPQELYRRLMGVNPTWSELFVEMLALYAELRGKERAGEKTPNHWRVVSSLLELFPKCRVIWVVRDARDTILSLMRVPWKRHSNLALHGVQWRMTTERMLACESQFPDRIHRVKFEELIMSPRTEIQRACQFVDLDFELRQLDSSVRTDAVPPWESAWKGRAACAPDPNRIGTAIREMPQKSIRLLNSIVGSCMRRLNYDLAAA